MTFPRIVGLMATKNRPAWALRATHQFLAQDYPGPTTFIVYDDSPEPWKPCNEIGNVSSVRYTHCPPTKLPVKRNQMMREAIALYPDALFTTWDDDDYHGPSQLSLMHAALAASPAAEGVIIAPALHYDRRDRTLRVTKIIKKHGLRMRVFTDAALLFKRSLWERKPWDENTDPNACWRWYSESHRTIIDTPVGGNHIIVRHNTNHMYDARDAEFWEPTTFDAYAIERSLETPTCCREPSSPAR